MDLPGFDHLIAQCKKFGLKVQLYPPAAELPNTQESLGTPLDPFLRALLSRVNGGQAWDLYLYGGDGSPNELETINKDLRLVSDDLPGLADFVLFAQLGHQPTHLAVVPASANSEGLQPVVYLDLNEDMKVLPLASNLDRSLDLIARYLERLVANSGDIEQGVMDLQFPWDVPELLVSDKELLTLIDQGWFDRYSATDPRVKDWLKRISELALLK